MSDGHYGRLASMAILSFIAMYVLMYAMVNSPSNVLANINQFYMAGLMVAPMVIIELALMGKMYRRKPWNVAFMVVSLILGVMFWFGIRRQIAVGDRQFLRSMIAHHAGAILMCQHAKITDAEITRLCGEIIRSQQSEIDQMKVILDRGAGQ
ncbi:MAG TPA: DUF305 domain-containing protein [Gemmatimonadaceae bacterium]|nr:DUF305 domain-containing protein [Gemmatimonadaceae bacterium]